MDQLYKNLEFDIILEKISELASSSVVASEILATKPTVYIDDAKKLLAQTSDALYILASKRPSLAFDDVLPIVTKARIGAVVQPYEFLAIGRSISALRSLKDCVESSDGCDSLKDITAWVRPCDDLKSAIDSSIENETDLKDSASEKLYTIRKAIKRANSRLKERLDSLTRQSEISKYLQDNIVTIRDGRYVVPVRAEYRSSVKGLVHDVSATGATVFIEPFAVVEANNELKTLKTEEAIEVERILVELGKTVVANADGLSEGQRVLTECGAIFAKAEFAKKTDAYAPILNENGRIVLNGARHPLIASDSVVPVDIKLNGEKHILLISGPNTGGKTVALKTVGLFALMAASGIFLPTHDGSEICIFESIYCDIGDSQSISQSLSTFSAHVKNLATITSAMTDRSLVLLDEVGDGTDPDEGAALAVAVIKKILRERATSVITTHFNSVKEFAIECQGIENACMQFDNINFRPTYKLLTGVSGSSYALEIAEKLGLDSQIVSDAKAALSGEKIAFDKVLREAEKMRNKASDELQKTEELRARASADAIESAKLKAEYERKLADINDKSRDLIKRYAAEYAEKAEELIDEIKENLKRSDEAALFAARKTAAKISQAVPSDPKKPQKSSAPPKPDELSDGVRVFVSGLEKEGIVVGNPRGNKAIVAIGQIKTEIPISSLTVISEKNARTELANNDSRVSEPVNRELMLLGLTVSEAIEEIDRALYDIPPHSTLRIVHGKGTGALGKGVQAYLKKCSRIKKYRYGGYGEGDSGVTIAEIK